MGKSNHVVFPGLLELGCGLGFWGHLLTSLGLDLQGSIMHVGDFQAQACYVL